MFQNTHPIQASTHCDTTGRDGSLVHTTRHMNSAPCHTSHSMSCDPSLHVHSMSHHPVCEGSEVLSLWVPRVERVVWCSTCLGQQRHLQAQDTQHTTQHSTLPCQSHQAESRNITHICNSLQNCRYRPTRRKHLFLSPCECRTQTLPRCAHKLLCPTPLLQARLSPLT